jgi:fibronectin type 3 domain-containing protein
MAIPGIPQNFNLQQGNGETFLSWNIVSGATSYSVQRSTDGVTFSGLATPTTNYYLDSSVTVGTNYYYQVASTNSSGTSSYTASQSIVPTNTADLSLGQIRLMSQQRADRVNSNFVTMPEWNSYISQSYFELYDLLVTVYEDYFVQTPYTFTTDGSSTQYTLPNDFYKLTGVDCGLATTSNAWVTLKKFDFISRNRYVYPNITSTFLGVFNLQYRLVGNTLMFIPTPSGGQYIRVWYIPKLTQPLQDTDILKGVSGWTEYIIVDAAIKALQKEESDVSVLMAQKMALIKRVEESSMNRDAGQPDTISNTRSWGERWGGYGGAGFDGSFGGY